MYDLLERANVLCNLVHGVSYREIYGFDVVEIEEIEKHITELERKAKFMEESSKFSEEGKFLKYWTDYWESVVVNQPVLCKLYALCAMSQTLRHVTILKAGGTEDDIRVNVCNIMPSGTGKSEGNDVLAKYAKRMGLIYASVDRYNDASLVGSVNKLAIEMNNRNGIKEGEEGWINPDEKGILRKSDLVVFDEGENILKTSKETEGAQRYLQKAMNRHGSEGNFITNALVGYQIGGYPHCCIVITSYYLDEFEETLLERGLLQRMVVYYQEENYDKRTKIIDSIIDGIPSFNDDVTETLPIIQNAKARHDEYLRKICNEAEALRKFHIDTKCVSIKNSGKDSIRKGVDELRNLMPFLAAQRDVWESMITRMSVNMLKIAAVHALIHYRTYIDEVDAAYASNLMLTTMKSMAHFLRANVKIKSNSRAIELYNVMRKQHIGERKTLREWVEVVMHEYGASEESAKAMVRNIIETNRMDEKIMDQKRTYVIK